ncbi:MAG: nucleoside 2-deoxyribosyltransferase [Proteobacteria bacterium]|nr:nucleoside 2-deoxyribosyltransferase [Pseudomonadota bacterium]MBU6424769.1 nucleoside 2-deoxyribosyltransferase [Rhodospirillales bacterium]
MAATSLRPKLYLAGPDVFLPRAGAQAEAKCALCARHGLHGLAPFNPHLDMSLPPTVLARAIYEDDMAMMRESDAILANLTPFRGASADAGTLVELGWFLGQGKPVFGYSNNAEAFAERSRRQAGLAEEPVPGLAIEDFGLADNLMIEASLTLPLTLPPDGVSRPFDSLEIFSLCVEQAAAWFRDSNDTRRHR